MAEKLDSSPNEGKARLRLDDWAKVAASLVLSLYVIGLVAVNDYLYGLGGSDFALVRPRFIYAGALVCGLAWVAYAVPTMAIEDAKRVMDDRRVKETSQGWRSWLSVLTRGWYGFSMPIFIFFGILVTDYGGFEYGALTLPILFGIAIFLTAASFFAVWFCVIIIRVVINGMRGHDLAPPLLGIAIFSILLIGVLYIPLFVNTIYNRVPEQFGGGRPRTVRLLLTNEGKNQMENLYPGVAGEVSSPRVKLLYQGTDYYLIDLGDRTTMLLQRNVVLGVVVKETEVSD